ncbi:MAG: lytic transglycosylase domain-containing protein [Pseudomonadota bacterium]
MRKRAGVRVRMQLVRNLAMAVALSSPATAQVVSEASIGAIKALQSSEAAAEVVAGTADPVTTDVLMWLKLSDGSASLADYNAFVGVNAEWPALTRLRTQAELVIPAGMRAADIVAWFGEDAPRTGQGAVRLARALRALDEDEAARDVLRDAWINLRLDDQGQLAMYRAFGPQLAPYHNARADALLWRHRTEDAARMLPLMEEDDAAVAAARIGYLERTRNMLALFRAVPEALRNDPGLAYARYNWLADRGNYTEAVKVLLERSTSRAALGEPFRWSGWRRILARWEMREGRAEQAYTLASRHYLTDGSSYADLEWLSGYLSLLYLGDPAQALGHFENGLRASSSPISVSRMQYWIGRTYEVKGELDAATAAFEAAAIHQTAFYGLLASERVGKPLDPIWAGAATDWEGHPVFDRPVVRAALILLAAGERGHAFTYFAHLGRNLPEEALAPLGAYLNHIDEQYYAVLLGKTAAARGVIIPDLYFPLHDLAQIDLPTDPALALSIARRESEFRVNAGSPVGALGLMQLMPATAEEVAGDLGLPYARGRLTTDWQYNATLGAAYLAYLEEEFGPTPVMIAAGYNAGPSRPFSWMEERGDPRAREMDIVDWIEHIPFRETRNYVMRVTESIPIYEARLSGIAGQVRFTDLLLGAMPVTRPKARPDRLGLPPEEPLLAADPVVAQPEGTSPILRPIARP